MSNNEHSEYRTKIDNLKTQMETYKCLTREYNNINSLKDLNKKLSEIGCAQQKMYPKNSIQEEIDEQKLKIKLQKLAISAPTESVGPFREYFSIKTIKQKYQNNIKHNENMADLRKNKRSLTMPKQNFIFNENLQPSNDKIKRQYEQLQKLHRNMQREYKITEKQTKEALEEVRELRGKVQQLNQIITNKNKQIRVYQRQIKESKQRRYQQNFSEMEQYMTLNNRLIEKSGIPKRIRKNTGSIEKYGYKQQENNNPQLLKIDIINLKEKLKRVEQEKVILQSNLEKDRRTIEELKHQIDDLKSDLKTYLEKFSKVDPTIQMLTQQLESERTKYSDLKMMLERIKMQSYQVGQKNERVIYESNKRLKQKFEKTQGRTREPSMYSSQSTKDLEFKRNLQSTAGKNLEMFRK